MVLVDTSVWIRGLAGRQPYMSGLSSLLDRGEAAGHDLIYGELLVGDSGARTRLLADYLHLPRIESIPHEEVAEFVRKRRLMGRGVGWIDAHLLASALAGRVELWSADERLSELARELGVLYSFPA